MKKIFIGIAILAIVVSLINAETSQNSSTKNDEATFNKYQQSADQNNPEGIYNLGVLYMNGKGVTKNIETARELFLKSANIGYGRAQYNMGVLYLEGISVKQDDNKSFKWFQMAAKQNLPEALYVLGWLSEEGKGVKKDRKKALVYYTISADWGEKRALEKIEKEPLLKKDLETYRKGMDAAKKGNYQSSIEYYLKSLATREKVLGSENIVIEKQYNTIGQLYHKAGEYSKSINYYKKALVIQKKKLEKENVGMAETYDNIGRFYKMMGHFSQALSYYKKSLAIREKILEKENADIAISYNNIGELYYMMGNYDQALNYYKRAVHLQKKKDNNKIAISYSNLGALFISKGDYHKAKSYYMKSLALRKKRLGEEDIATAQSYSDLGLLHQTMGENNLALSYYKKALAIQEKILGKTHLETALSYHNISLLYKKMGEFFMAGSYNGQALLAREDILGKEHILTAQSYMNCSSIEMNLGKKTDIAYKYAKRAFNIFLKDREKVFIILDAKQKEKYLKSTVAYIELFLHRAYVYIQELNKENKSAKTKQILQSGANAWLNYKGSIFDGENAIAMLYTSTKNKKLKAKIDDLVSSKRYLAKLYQSLPKPKEKNSWRNKIKTTEEKISKLTNEISSKATSLKEQQNLKSITYEDIAFHLKMREVYIDYAKVGNHYYLFSLDQKEHITFVRIGNKDTRTIDNLVKTFREEINSIREDNKISNEKLKHLTQSSKEKLSKLYELLIQKPLGNVIKNKQCLIISPDRALRLLPFETLYNKESDKYFIEEKEIRYIPSGKELVRLYEYHPNKSTNNTSVIFADPNFNTNLKSHERGSTAVTPNTSDSGIVESLFTMKDFAALPGTKAEAKAIKSILGESSTTEYLQENATESNLIQVKEPHILHIATHGFFINDNTIPNPMLKSGIVLTGANKSRIKGVGDGIVTALKLSGLDLKGTDLVVLSACETGVVDINSTDSVSGLSKAFIQAGARDIVMSLWSVDDQATKELMISFYQEMQENKNYAEALKAAKLKMIADGRHPFYWGAFVVSGL